MNSGLYDRAGISATCSAAARANWLELPLTKVSNVYRGFSPAPAMCTQPSSRAAEPRVDRVHAVAATTSSRSRMSVVTPPRASTTMSSAHPGATMVSSASLTSGR